MKFDRLLRLWRRRWTRLKAHAAGRDLRWKPTGIRQVFTGADDSTAVKAALRASIQADQRRLNEARRAQPVDPPKAARKPRPKKADGVVRPEFGRRVAK